MIPDKFLIKINDFRRNAMRVLTRNIGSSYTASNPTLNPVHPIKVLISRPNHRLGNLLLITPLLEEISTIFPKAKIDLFVKGGLPSVLFNDHPNVNKIIQLPRKPFKQLSDYLKTWLLLRKSSYDLVINIDKASSSGTLSTNFAKSKYKIFGVDFQSIPDHQKDQRHIAKNPVYALRNFLKKAGVSTKASIPGLKLTLSAEELAFGKKIVDELVPSPNNKTICLFTYATGTKCYSKDWWFQFYDILKENFTEYNFIEVLPIEKVSNLSFQVPFYYSQDVRELASVIANTSVFIGADSGIMHLASSVQTPTVGLFSVSNEERYCPYGEGNIAINTDNTSMEVSMAIIKKILDSKIS